METGIIIVGAGVAGLSCAQKLVAAGIPVHVLEKSAGIGGRCATRRVNGVPVDHGVSYYHGSDPDFLAALRSAAPESEILMGWPEKVEGNGWPCQPRSLSDAEFRLAFRDGMTTFPKKLAEGIAIQRETRVERLEIDGDRFTLTSAKGETFTAHGLVLALPVPQTHRLMQQVNTELREFRSFQRVLEMTDTVSSLTLLLGYDNVPNQPDWSLLHPNHSKIIQVVSHESSKRPSQQPPPGLTLVAHGFPAWSKEHFENDAAVWSKMMLDELGSLLGSWAATPTWKQAHRWRYSRASGEPTLKEPLYFCGAGKPKFGIAGEAFAPSGGVQAAWKSGRKLADLMIGDWS